MDSYTIRLPEDAVEKMEQEADERGFSNRTEYMRHILLNRPAVDNPPNDDLDDRVAELEDKFERLQEQLE